MGEKKLMRKQPEIQQEECTQSSRTSGDNHINNTFTTLCSQYCSQYAKSQLSNFSKCLIDQPTFRLDQIASLRRMRDSLTTNDKTNNSDMRSPTQKAQINNQKSNPKYHEAKRNEDVFSPQLVASKNLISNHESHPYMSPILSKSLKIGLTKRGSLMSEEENSEKQILSSTKVLKKDHSREISGLISSSRSTLNHNLKISKQNLRRQNRENNSCQQLSTSPQKQQLLENTFQKFQSLFEENRRQVLRNASSSDLQNTSPNEEQTCRSQRNKMEEMVQKECDKILTDREIVKPMRSNFLKRLYQGNLSRISHAENELKRKKTFQQIRIEFNLLEHLQREKQIYKSNVTFEDIANKTSNQRQQKNIVNTIKPNTIKLQNGIQNHTKHFFSSSNQQSFSSQNQQSFSSLHQQSLINESSDKHENQNINKQLDCQKLNQPEETTKRGFVKVRRNYLEPCWPHQVHSNDNIDNNSFYSSSEVQLDTYYTQSQNIQKQINKELNPVKSIKRLLRLEFIYKQTTYKIYFISLIKISYQTYKQSKQTCTESNRNVKTNKMNLLLYNFEEKISSVPTLKSQQFQSSRGAKDKNKQHHIFHPNLANKYKEQREFLQINTQNICKAINVPFVPGMTYITLISTFIFQLFILLLQNEFMSYQSRFISLSRNVLS